MPKAKPGLRTGIRRYSVPTAPANPKHQATLALHGLRRKREVVTITDGANLTARCAF